MFNILRTVSECVRHQYWLGHNSIISDIVVQVDALKDSHRYNNCDRVFSPKGNLKIHMSTHSGQKPYWCTNCENICLQKGNLEIYMSTHSGEKPY